eukprot:m.445123 g.445123  ORF g.445123 m.445123 type:complete len:62 (-) comp56845_c0_seq2:1043-1228(-)
MHLACMISTPNSLDEGGGFVLLLSSYCLKLSVLLTNLTPEGSKGLLLQAPELSFLLQPSSN